MTVRKAILSTLVACAITFATSSLADTFTFSQLSNNAGQDISPQLSVDVTDAGGEVCFSFSNIGPISSVIAEIYFDDAPPGAGNDLGYLGEISMISGSAGGWTAYEGSPNDLPGGNTATPPFTTAGNPVQYATADNPSPANGISNGTIDNHESLNIYFFYKNNGTIDDVVQNLRDGALRIGLHVTGIGTSGQSDAYITGGLPVPDGGATIALLGMGLAVLGVGKIKTRKRSP